MTLLRLILHSLRYHWRGNLAVLLGVTVGTAVLTGALLVGDSLRGSLRDQALQQLGWVDRALVGGRFFRAELARELGEGGISPAILMRGAATRQNESGKAVSQAGRVSILGVDARFWPEDQVPEGRDFWQSTAEEVVLNQALAKDLGVAAGQTVTLNLQTVSAVPRESLLGKREASEVIYPLDLKVRAVLPDQGLGRFNLIPSPEPARNAFLPLATLQAALKQKGRANALLVGSGAEDLQGRLRQHLTLEDWGLVLKEPKDRAGQPRGYLSLESRQMLVEPAVATGADRAGKEAGARLAPTLVYLANTIAAGTNEIPYSVVAALDPAQAVPLGPFLPPGVDHLNDDEIVLVDWKESPLHPQVGQPITLAYFKPEDEGRLPEVKATFKFRGLIPLTGVANDRNLTPEFPGITDKLNIQDWNPPFPFDNKRVKRRDEQYWEKYRTTPKAYITLTAGQKLWGSRFGQLTSIRLAPRMGDLATLRAAFGPALLRNLSPEQGGLVFDNVRERSLKASAGSTDFGEYFLYFSGFLILAALLLVGLLFRLNLDRRASEVGILRATGYRARTVRWLMLAEGTILAVIGGLIGLVGALGYAWLLLEHLRYWWPTGLEGSFLRLHVTPESFLIGYSASLVVSVLTILWAVRVLAKASPRALLAGMTTPESTAGVTQRPPRWSVWIAIVAGVGALALVVAGRFVQGHEEQAGTFFGSGALLLTACLAGVWAWMRGTRHRHLVEQGGGALARLGVRNAARHPVRSLLTVGLLASAVFVVVAVESFHRDASQISMSRDGGTGGFALMAESNVPLYQDLNTGDGRRDLNIQDPDASFWRDVHISPFRLRRGDDTSCLNLYRPTRPSLLGVPASLIAQKRFAFAATEAKTPEERDNPWRLLEGDADGAIPVIGDATTLQFILNKKLGETLTVPDERGDMYPLRVVGLLADSIFQSQLLISEANFLKLYPSQDGYSFFLIDALAAQVGKVKELLDSALADRGFEATTTAQRLASFWAVENTYLSTFQAVGGLGLLLGALGLAVVLLRTVWERRGELALFRALGFRRSALSWLVLSENSFLLAVGLGVGVVAALIAVVPHLGTSGGEVPWQRLLVLIGAVLAVGFLAAALAVRASLRAALVPALRRE
jgi:ABC-type antimicrobial peptide transport system permease subunit